MTTEILNNLYVPNIVCGCPLLPDTKMCSKQATHLFRFSSGRMKFSCGIEKHKNDIIRTIDPDENLSVYIKYKSVFKLEKRSLTAEDLYGNNRLFEGPLTYKGTLSKRINYLDMYFYELEAELEKMIAYINTYMKEYHTIRVTVDNHYNGILPIVDTKILTGILDDLIQKVKNADEYSRSSKNVMLEMRSVKEEYDNCVTSYNMNTYVSLPFEYDLSNRTECPICMCNVDKYTGGHTHCNHPFHNHCINKWLQNQNSNVEDDEDYCFTCPTCRKDIEYFITPDVNSVLI